MESKYILTEEEINYFLEQEPLSTQFVDIIMGTDHFIINVEMSLN
jgi:hypothetical protein